jgi:hypothetical protein
MRHIRFFILSGLLLATVCGPAASASDPAFSLQHLLKDSDCEAAPELVGNWTNDDLGGAWAVQKLGDRKYRLIQNKESSDNSNRMAFDICVAHLGGYLFFDATSQVVQPDGEKPLRGGDDDLFWIPLHLFGRLDIENDAIHFRLLDDAWLQDALKAGRVHLTCARDDEGGYILTAPSSELKQFATLFANDPKAFSYDEEFARAPSESAHQHQRLENSETANHRGGVL